MNEPMVVRTFRDLVVWQKGINLVSQLYQVTRAFPREELYGLTAELRKCGIAIPSQIAEGYCRGSQEFPEHLQKASGALFVLQTHLQVAVDLKYLESKPFTELANASADLERMLTNLIRKLRNKQPAREPEGAREPHHPPGGFQAGGARPPSGASSQSTRTGGR